MGATGLGCGREWLWLLGPDQRLLVGCVGIVWVLVQQSFGGQTLPTSWSPSRRTYLPRWW